MKTRQQVIGWMTWIMMSNVKVKNPERLAEIVAHMVLAQLRSNGE